MCGTSKSTNLSLAPASTVVLEAFASFSSKLSSISLSCFSSSSISFCFCSTSSPPGTAPPSIAFSLLFSSCSSRIILSCGFSLMTALFLIFLARSAYRKVDKVSSWLLEAGEIAQIMIVLLEPPSAFCRSRVSFESLYGITCPALPLPVDFSANFSITLPSADNDLLIAHPSFSRSPDAPVCPAFSLPAKSTKLIMDILLPELVSCLNSMVRTVCARDDVAFMRVAPRLRLAVPSCTTFSTAAYEVTGRFVTLPT
mmetsp:Transcript_41917/g.98287  ORF Transcript_41917/g.98287 Transcript_41917/m.98287 type:complete len:255 (-) Transcript_41917:621-1385(-)